MYLQAHAIRCRGNGSSDSATATGYLKQALELDPAFAPAWAELANNLAADYSTFGVLPFQQTRDQAHDAAERALKLDPALPLAYLGMGRLLYQLDWNWGAADVAIRKAISLEAGNAEAFRVAGYLATTLGRFDEGIELLKSAIALDPLQPWNYVATGFATNRTGDLTATERVYKKAIDLNPTGGKVHYLLGSVLLQQNRPREALIEMQRQTDNGYRHCGLALALGALGRMSESDSELTNAEKDFALDKRGTPTQEHRVGPTVQSSHTQTEASRVERSCEGIVTGTASRRPALVMDRNGSRAPVSRHFDGIGRQPATTGHRIEIPVQNRTLDHALAIRFPMPET